MANSQVWDQGLGLRILESWFWILGFGPRVFRGVGLRVEGFRTWGLGMWHTCCQPKLTLKKAKDAVLRVSGLGFEAKTIL